MEYINVNILCNEDMLQKYTFKTQFLKFYFCVWTHTHTHQTQNKKHRNTDRCL